MPGGTRFTTTVGSHTITLEQLALPKTGNYRMAVIPIGGSNTHFYTVEVRRSTGYDVKLPGQAVIIHEVDVTRGISAHVIDPDLNGSTGDAGAMWVVGETFTDNANEITVSIDSAVSSGFVITIALGGTAPTATATWSPTSTSPTITETPTMPSTSTPLPPTSSPSATSTWTPTVTNSPTPSPSATSSPTWTPTATSSPTPSSTAENEYEPEDINQDDEVDMLDVQLCVDVFFGTETDPEIVDRADINGDGTVDVLDIQTILNVLPQE
jgi:hypothetical protein